MESSANDSSRLAPVIAATHGCSKAPAGNSQYQERNNPMDLTIDQKRALVIQFATAVQAADRAGLEAAANPDITWTVPGASRISGQQHGVDGVLWLAKMFSGFGYQIAVQELTFGVNDIAVEIRGTGNHNGRIIDVAAVNVLKFRDRGVVAVGTHFSDLDSVDAYFA
jgi:uncharacterized protein